MSSPPLSFHKQIENYAKTFYEQSIDRPHYNGDTKIYGDFKEFLTCQNFLSSIFRDPQFELDSFNARLFNSDSLVKESQLNFARFTAVLLLRLLSIQPYSSAHDPPLAERHVLLDKQQCLLDKVTKVSKVFKEYNEHYLDTRLATLTSLRQLFTSWTKDMEIQTSQIANITSEKSSLPPKAKTLKSGQSKISVILHRHVVSVKNDSVNSSSCASPSLPSICLSPPQPPRSSSPSKKSASPRPSTPPVRPTPCVSPVKISPRATCSPKSPRVPVSSGLLPTPSPGILPTPPPCCSIAALNRPPAASFSPPAPALSPDTLAPILASYLTALLSTPCPLPPPSPRAPPWHCKPRIKV